MCKKVFRWRIRATQIRRKAVCAIEKKNNNGNKQPNSGIIMRLILRLKFVQAHISSNIFFSILQINMIQVVHFIRPLSHHYQEECLVIHSFSSFANKLDLIKRIGIQHEKHCTSVPPSSLSTIHIRKGLTVAKK